MSDNETTSWIYENRDRNETDDQWMQRRDFMLRNVDKIEKKRLICLSKVYANNKVLKCKYDKTLMKQVKELDQRPAKVAAAKSDSKDKIKSEPKVEFASKPVTTKDEEAEPVQLKEEIVREVDVEDVEPVDNEPLKAEEPQDEEVHFEDEEVHQEDLRYEVQLEDDAQREEPEVVKLEDEESRKTPDAEEDNTVNNNEPSPLKEERKWPPTLSKQKSVVKSGEPDEDDWAKKNISRSKVNALIARFQSGAAFNNNQQQTCSSTYKSEYGVSGKIGQIQQSRFN